MNTNEPFKRSLLSRLCLSRLSFPHLFSVKDFSLPVDITRCHTTACVTGFVWFISALSSTGQVMAQDVDPEWPCVQRLIPEVSPAVMWPVPVEEGMDDAYRQDTQIRALAEQLGDIELFTDKHRQAIADFASGVPDAERDHKLTLLASGVVDVSNRIRKDYIRGIKRYTRQQIAISQQIEDTLNQLSLLESDNLPDNGRLPVTDNVSTSDSVNSAGQSRQEIEETLRWHERVYDQRERNIQLLCEEPVELEQQLSEVLRDAAQYLP